MFALLIESNSSYLCIQLSIYCHALRPLWAYIFFNKSHSGNIIQKTKGKTKFTAIILKVTGVKYGFRLSGKFSRIWTIFKFFLWICQIWLTYIRPIRIDFYDYKIVIRRHRLFFTDLPTFCTTNTVVWQFFDQVNLYSRCTAGNRPFQKNNDVYFFFHKKSLNKRRGNFIAIINES